MPKTKKKAKTLTNLEIAYIVDTEGLGYAITDYMGSENFEDQHLAELWDTAQETLQEIQDVLEEALDDAGEDHI